MIQNNHNLLSQQNAANTASTLMGIGGLVQVGVGLQGLQNYRRTLTLKEEMQYDLNDYLNDWDKENK